MKKHLLALAALATVSGLAAAQSVTIYGVVDSALQVTSKNSTNNGSTTSLRSGGTTPSIFGFKGTEDLGGGLKANFNLEGHFTSTTGEAQQWGGLFGRQANVGVSGGFGAIALGKQYTPAVLAFASTDPRGLKETNSGLMTWAFSANNGTNNSLTATASQTANSNTVIDVFAPNAVSYNTTVGAVGIGALYGLGGVAGHNDAGRQISAGLTYAGPVALSASLQTANGTGSATGYGKTNQKYATGIGYTVGALTLKANYMQAKNYNGSTGAELANYTVYGVGANYALNSANTLTVAYYDGKNKKANDSKVRSYILSNDYALSKRTTIYGLVGVADAGANGGAGAAAVEAFVAGKNVSVYQLGIKHAF